MKHQKTLILPAAAGILLIVTTSLLQGRWTERWHSSVSETLLGFAEAFETIPITVGDWDGEDSPEASEREKERAGAVGQLSRTYRNPKTGETVSVFMICGASRDVAIHTPDACYPGAGFRMEGKSQPYNIQYARVTDAKAKAGKQPEATESAVFTTAVFVKEEPTGTQRLRLFWAWNADGRWEAPAWPRMKYGGRTPLNKIYLIAPAPANQPPEESPALEFVKIFFSDVDQRLFPNLSASPAAKPAAEESAAAASTED